MAAKAKRPAAASRARRPAITSYPMPTPEAVRAMERELFSNRFVDEYLSALLARASIAVSAEMNADMSRRGMPIHHWRVLGSLSDSGPLTLAELSDLTVIKQPTLTRIVQRMEKQGWIRKSADPHDRRLVRLSLTGRGKAEVRDLVRAARERQRRLLDGLDADQLVGALRHLIAFCAARRRRKRMLL